jgi:hypothetical protein
VQAARSRLQQEGVCGNAPGQPACDKFIFCTLGDAGEACHRTGEQPTAGWCYVDPAQNPNDDKALVEKCAANEQRIIRFVDPLNRTPEPDAKVLIACFGASKNAEPTMTPMP